MDAAILDAIIAHRSPALTPAVVALTQSTRPFFMLAAGGGLSAVLAYRRYARASFPLVAVGAAWAASSAIKQLVGRARPDAALHLVAEHNYSFPSGHATASFALAMALTLYFRSWWTLPAWLLAVLVGASRLYVGVHWPSDVLAGAALGVGVAAAAWALWPGQKLPDAPAPENPPE